MIPKELLEQVEKLGFVPRTLSTRWTFEFIIGRGKDFMVTEICESNLLSEIQRWLRITFDLYCTPYRCKYNKETKFESILIVADKYDIEEDEVLPENFFDTYEEALIDSIKDAIVLINTYCQDNEYKSGTITESN